MAAMQRAASPRSSTSHARPRTHQRPPLSPPQAKGARLVSITSQRGSALEAACDLAVHLPLERELCPFDLAPVTSTAIQMIFGDTVAIALMQARGRRRRRCRRTRVVEAEAGGPGARQVGLVPRAPQGRCRL